MCWDPCPQTLPLGYDHIAGAIGGALAGLNGADFLCYVTPKEHVGLPDSQDVRDGVVVTKLAAHIVDIAKGNKQAISRDRRMAQARQRVDWQAMLKYALDPQKFGQLREQECRKNPKLKTKKYCSMCGDFCVFKL